MCAVERKIGPSSLIFSRQNLTFQKRDNAQIANIRKGGYVLSEAASVASGGKPQAIIIATGSEVALAMQAQKALADEGIHVRVVSMPCTNVFDRQTEAYQDHVLPLNLPTVAIEAAHPDFWRKYVGRTGVVVGMATFGESAPAKDLYAYFGISAERVVIAVRTLAHRASHRNPIELPDQIVPANN